MILTQSRTRTALAVTIVAFTLCGSALHAQTSGDGGTPGSTIPATKPAPATPPGQDTSAASENPDLQKTLKDIQDYLKAQQPDESDFGLVLGLGSLLTSPNITDYEDQSNVLNVTHLGKATPQLLTGVSFRTRVPSLFTRFGCPGKPRQKTSSSGSRQGTTGTSPCSASAGTGDETPKCYGEI